MQPAFIAATFNGVEAQAPSSARVMLGEYAHDVAALTIPGARTASSHYSEGTPVVIRYGRTAGTQRRFYGYVHHAEGFFGQRSSTVRVVCIGTSYVLRSGDVAVWKTMTVPDVIRSVAARALLAADVDGHSLVWEALSQAGESSWDFLVSLARQIGFTLFCPPGQVRAFDPRQNDRQLRQEAVLVTADTIAGFRPLVGDVPEAGARMAQTVAGIDPRSGQAFAVSAGPFGYLGAVAVAPMGQTFTGSAVGSPLEAAGRLVGQLAANRWVYRASAQIVGDPRLRQGMYAYLSGVDRVQDGFWYVQAAEHEFELATGVYRTYLTLGRDSYSPTAFVGGSAWRPQRDPFGDNRGALPALQLVNGAWRSAWAAGRTG